MLFLPTPAEAHTPVKGFGEFANGFLHPFLTPPHVLVFLSLGILLGRRIPFRIQQPVLVFAAFAVTGLFMSAFRFFTGVPQPVLITLGLCAGGFIVLAIPLPTWLYLAACAAAGLALGSDSGVDPGTTGAAMVKTLFATWVSLILCVADIAFYVARLPTHKWMQTGVRVAGSWIVAIALLILAFTLRR